MRNVPSDTATPASRPAPRSHRLRRPAWHGGHFPQEGMKDSTTWSPMARSSTPGPTSMTMPAPSCPPHQGKPGMRMPPVIRWWSEWHMPDASIWIFTSSLRGSPISISSTDHGWLNSQSNAPFVFISCLPLPLTFSDELAPLHEPEIDCLSWGFVGSATVAAVTVNALTEARGLLSHHPIDGRRYPGRGRRHQQRGQRSRYPRLADSAVMAEGVESGLAVVSTHPAVTYPAERRAVDRGVQHEIVASDATIAGAVAIPAEVVGVLAKPIRGQR